MKVFQPVESNLGSFPTPDEPNLIFKVLRTYRMYLGVVKYRFLVADRRQGQ